MEARLNDENILTANQTFLIFTERNYNFPTDPLKAESPYFSMLVEISSLLYCPEDIEKLFLIRGIQTNRRHFLK